MTNDPTLVGNEFYVTVLPIIHMGKTEFGKTEEIITLFPDRNFATEFFPDEVEAYVATFRNRLNYITGGHVKKWQVFTEATATGRVIVRVIQYVG
jgi:hypothetical protein